MKRLRIVEIRWMDTVCLTDWRDVEAVKEHEIPIIKSVGYLVKKTNTHIVICMGLDIKHEETTEVLLIPNGMIIKTKFLT